MTTTHSFVTTCSLVIRCTRPPAISPEEFGTSHNIAIIKKNLRSQMSFTPGNGISNEVPSNCGISIEVSRRTLPSLSCSSAVVVCAFVVDVLFCFCCCCCVDPVLPPTSNDKLRCCRFSGVVAALLARDFPSGNAQVHFLPPKPHYWLTSVLFLVSNLSPPPGFLSIQLSKRNGDPVETEIRYSYHVMVILQQFQARLAVVLEIFCCGSAWW